MARAKSVEIHIVVDKEGVACVQIVGPVDTHPEGHDLYLKIRDLVQAFDRQIQQKLQNQKDELNA